MPRKETRRRLRWRLGVLAALLPVSALLMSSLAGAPADAAWRGDGCRSPLTWRIIVRSNRGQAPSVPAVSCRQWYVLFVAFVP